ncbi:MAG: MG2 domain-containing protein, partial [Thermodesulfobacteriota bacterium]
MSGADGSISRVWRPLPTKNLLKLAGLLMVAAILAWGPGLQPTAAQTAPAPAFDGQKHFTITKIEPNAGKEQVNIFFSQPVPLDILRAYLGLLPRVKLDWNRSRVSPSGVLTLKGDFKYGAGHVVTMKEGVTVNGRTYVPTVTTFTMPDRPALVEFVGAKRVIERDSRQLLHVRVSNVENVKLAQIKVPPLLLPQALAAEQAGADLQQTLEGLRQAQEQLAPLIKGKNAYTLFTGAPLEEKQLFPAGGEKNRVLAVSLPLSFRRHKEAGALELIRVQDNQVGSGAAAGPRLFRLTDLGLTYKIGDQSLLLWVTSLKDGAPAAGVQVLAVTRQTEVFPLGVTDKDGILIFTPRELEGLSLKQLGGFYSVKRQVEKNDLTFLLAGKKGDVSYIEVKPHGNIEPEDVWHAATPKQPQNLKGVVFTERGVYRPGEQVFFKGTVRQYREGAIVPPEAQNCVFVAINPRGEQVFLKKFDLSEFGTAAGEIMTQPHWALGTYTLNMYFGPRADQVRKAKQRRAENPYAGESGGQKSQAPRPEASTTFQVQEFKPPRHFTDVTFERFSREDKTYVNRERTAEFVRIKISGAYYAGGPVKHGQVRWRIYQAPTDYKIQGFDTYSFGYAADDKGALIESGQAILDEQGQTAVEFPLDRYLLAGRQGISVTATVVDFDGRAASAGKAYQVEPDFLVGISRHPDSFNLGEENELQVVVLDKQRQPVKQGTVQAQVLEQSWSYVAKRNE